MLKTPSPSRDPGEFPRLPDPNVVFPPTPRRWNTQQDSTLERPKTLEFLPRPRPSANRQRLDPWWFVSPSHARSASPANSSSTETPSNLDSCLASSSSTVEDRPGLPTLLCMIATWSLHTITWSVPVQSRPVHQLQYSHSLKKYTVDRPKRQRCFCLLDNISSYERQNAGPQGDHHKQQPILKQDSDKPVSWKFDVDSISFFVS